MGNNACESGPDVCSGTGGPSSDVVDSGPVAEAGARLGVLDGDGPAGADGSAGVASDAVGDACVLQAVQARSSPIQTSRFAAVARVTLPT